MGAVLRREGRRRLLRLSGAARALEVDAVLLEVAGDVLAGEALDVHEAHDGLGYGTLVAEVRHRLDEPVVQLRRPHHPRLLPGPPASARAADSGGGVLPLLLPLPLPLIVLVLVLVLAAEGQVRGGGVVREDDGAVEGGGGGEGGAGAPDVDPERGGERRRDERVRERRQLLLRGQAVLPLEHAAARAGAGAGVVVVFHVRVAG